MHFLIVGSLVLALIVLLVVKAVTDDCAPREILEQKAHDVRELLSQNGTQYQIVVAIIGRCSHLNGNLEEWRHAAIAQTQQVLGVPLAHARALVSEFAPVDDLIMRNHDNLLDI